MSEHVRLDQARNIQQLLHEAAEFRAHDPGRVQHVMTGLCRVLDAELGASTRELEFTPGAKGTFRIDAVASGDVALASIVQVVADRGFEYHPVGAALVRARPTSPNEVIAVIRSELVPDRSWYRSPYYEEYLETTGLDHLLVSIRCSVADPSAHGLAFYRRKNARAFDREDRNLLKLFHADVLAHLPMPASARSDSTLGWGGGDSFEQRVRAVIRHGFLVGQAGVAWVAGELGMSPRTLHRALLREELRFFALLDQERRDWTESLLGAAHLDAQFLATSLGFHTQTAFRKAFKRWTTFSPSEYRRAVHRTLELGGVE